jgi:hypothetical protein
MSDNPSNNPNPKSETPKPPSDNKPPDQKTPPKEPSAAERAATNALVESLIHANTPEPKANPPAAPVSSGTISPPATNVKPVKAKKSGPKLVFAVTAILLLLVSLPIIVYMISQRNQIGDNRGKAAGEGVYPSPTIDFWPPECDGNPFKVLCKKDYPNICPGLNNTAAGRMCAANNCQIMDACATGGITPGGSCSGLPRLSYGEDNNGGFVGCNGCQNCFCSGDITVGQTYSSGSVSCYPDQNNDSCGANINCTRVEVTPQNTPPNNPSNTPTRTPTQNPSKTPTPTPTPGTCKNIAILKGVTTGGVTEFKTNITSTLNSQANVVVAGDVIRIVWTGDADATAGRIRVVTTDPNIGWNSDTSFVLPYTDTTVINMPGKSFYFDYTIPEFTTSSKTFQIETEVMVNNTWK